MHNKLVKLNSTDLRQSKKKKKREEVYWSVLEGEIELAQEQDTVKTGL